MFKIPLEEEVEKRIKDCGFQEMLMSLSDEIINLKRQRENLREEESQKMILNCFFQEPLAIY